LSAAGALAISVDSRTRFGITLGEAVFLIALAALRIFMAVGTGPLRRRRAFDPDRVRDAPPPALGWPYWLVLASVLLVGASFLTSWLGFLDGRTHHAAKTAAYILWVAIAAAGFAGAAFAYATSKDGSLVASAWLAARGGAALAGATALIQRFVLQPSARIVDKTSEWLPAGDDALGRASLQSGKLAAASLRAPALPVLFVMAVLLALLVALLSPGVLR
jgi:hypothetical protein